MEVSKLPISATQRGKLISAGYTSLSSICSASSSDISRGNFFYNEFHIPIVCYNCYTNYMHITYIKKNSLAALLKTDLKISETEAVEILKVASKSWCQSILNCNPFPLWFSFSFLPIMSSLTYTNLYLDDYSSILVNSYEIVWCLLFDVCGIQVLRLPGTCSKRNRSRWQGLLHLVQI